MLIAHYRTFKMKPVQDSLVMKINTDLSPKIQQKQIEETIE